MNSTVINSKVINYIIIEYFWFSKYPELTHEEVGTNEMDQQDNAEDEAGIHLPSMSYYPILISAGITLAMAGLFEIWWLLGLGTVIGIWGLLGWSFEPPSEGSGH